MFGFWPVDEIIWFFLWVLSILVFYEHFYERERGGHVSKKFKYIALPTFILLTVVLIKAGLETNALILSHAYLFSALPAILPVAWIIKNRPKLLTKFFKTGLFFFMLYLVYELTALSLGQWYFSGEYVGWIEINKLRFPIEELLFWMVISNFSVLSIYEGFIDDQK